MYHKRHLVPFGEFVPLESMLRGLITFFDLPMSSFSRGSDKQAPLKAAGQLLAPTVCYEDAFGEEVIDFLPAATLLINGSNNAWYGDSFAPHQHLQISRMRAVETGRPLLRATTNGISAIIDHKGYIVKRSPQFETYVLSGEVQPRSGATLYVRWGNWPVILFGFFVLGVVGLRYKFYNK
jgi:apolipoprotein N-acyltransferase